MCATTPSRLRYHSTSTAGLGESPKGLLLPCCGFSERAGEAHQKACSHLVAISGSVEVEGHLGPAPQASAAPATVELSCPAQVLKPAPHEAGFFNVTICPPFLTWSVEPTRAIHLPLLAFLPACHGWVLPSLPSLGALRQVRPLAFVFTLLIWPHLLPS